MVVDGGGMERPADVLYYYSDVLGAAAPSSPNPQDIIVKRQSGPPRDRANQTKTTGPTPHRLV